MASVGGDLVELTKGHEFSDFKPYAYYGEEEDSLTYYFSGEADYARRLNSRVTAFFSIDSNELVGCQIKSVKHVLDEIGSYDVTIRHGRIRIDLFFLACRPEFADNKELYKRIGEAVSKSPQIDVEIPQSEISGCAC